MQIVKARVRVCRAKACRCMQRGKCQFEITLTEGRNRQIRRMCEALGYRVLALHRTQVADITLDDVKPGQWRDLNSREMRTVRRVLEEASEHERRGVPAVHDKVPGPSLSAERIRKPV